MSYRDNLAAAQARADAALKSLADERESREDDATYLAELERTLAASLQELAQLREQQERDEAAERPQEVQAPAQVSVPSRSSINGIMSVIGGLFLLISLGTMYFILGASNPNDTSYEYAEQAYDKPVYEEKAVVVEAITQFDVTSGLSQASTLASTHFGNDVIGEPYLVRIQATAVDDKGLSHLEYGDVTYRYSVKRPPLPDNDGPPSPAPLGTRPPKVVEPDTRPCYVDVVVDQQGMRIDSANQPSAQFPAPDMPGILGLSDINRQHSSLLALVAKIEGSCDQAKLENLCPVAAIRQAAVALGAPPDALASVSIGGFAPGCDDNKCADEPEAVCCIKRATNWRVQVIDRGEILFGQMVANQCEPPADTKPNMTQ